MSMHLIKICSWQNAKQLFQMSCVRNHWMHKTAVIFEHYLIRNHIYERPLHSVDFPICRWLRVIITIVIPVMKLKTRNFQVSKIS